MVLASWPVDPSYQARGSLIYENKVNGDYKILVHMYLIISQLPSLYGLSRPELQGDTGAGVLVEVPLGIGKAVSQHQKWCCCFPVIVINLITFTDPSSKLRVGKEGNFFKWLSF